MSQTIDIHYKFVFEDGQDRSYQIAIDGESGSLVPQKQLELPDWTKLEVSKCSHCPYKVENLPHCPVAVNLHQALATFKDELSYRSCEVQVSTAARTYSKTISLQEGLFGLFGLIMSTSACAHMDFLKPMARYHLPFSTAEETVIRSTSLYLLKQLMIAKSGGVPDWDLKNFSAMYEKVQLVNQGIIGRVRKMKTKGDADQNAVVILDSFASLLSMELSQDFQNYKSIFLK